MLRDGDLSLEASVFADAPANEVDALMSRTTDFGGGRTTLPLPGHTPGHSGLRLDSEGGSLLRVADTVHCQLLPLPRPERGVVFDADRELARSTRERFLDQLATDRTSFSGSHCENTPLGRIACASQGCAFESL